TLECATVIRLIPLRMPDAFDEVSHAPSLPSLAQRTIPPRRARAAIVCCACGRVSEARCLGEALTQRRSRSWPRAVVPDAYLDHRAPWPERLFVLPDSRGDG